MNYIKLNTPFSPKDVQWLDLNNLDLALDIGAYTGDSIVGIKSMGYKNIICFEPDPANFSKLKTKYGNDPSLTLVRCAVSDRDRDVIKMYSTRNLPFLNTLDKTWITGTRHKQYFRPNQFEEFDVKTVKLDTFIKSLNKSIGYIKIDVEGHEKQVLDGMSFKSELLSFEWISEKLEMNLSCIQRLVVLGYTKFTICFGEELPTKLSIWLDNNKLSTALMELKKHDSSNSLSGNIFCK